MTGLEVAYTKDWPAWKYIDHHTHITVHKPDYIHQNPCRTEKRSMFSFVLDAERIDDFVSSTFIPSFLLVTTSFVGPFLSLNALMPRIATGFISFLTLSNKIDAKLALLPKVTYPVWLKIFLDTQRYFIFGALMETAVAHVIQDRFSTRTAMRLDDYARIALPVTYVTVMSYLYFGAPQSENAEEDLNFMQNVTRAIGAIVVAIGAVWVKYSYNRLMMLLRKKPIEVHKSSRVHLDKNELHKLFDFIDIDGGKSLDMSEIVIMMLGLEDIVSEYSSGEVAKAGNVTVNRDDCPEKVKVMIATLEKKFGQVLNKESFNANHRAIFSEVDIFLTQNPEMDRLWHDHMLRIKKTIQDGTINQPSVPASPGSGVTPGEMGGVVPVVV
jgi:hypothetical protein